MASRFREVHGLPLLRHAEKHFFHGRFPTEISRGFRHLRAHFHRAQADYLWRAPWRQSYSCRTIAPDETREHLPAQHTFFARIVSDGRV